MKAKTFINMLTGQTVTPTDWQLTLTVGDYYRIDLRDLTIYGHITAHKGRKDSGFFWSDGFSILCPDGELGVVCIVDCTAKITEEEFNAARLREWRAS